MFFISNCIAVSETTVLRCYPMILDCTSTALCIEGAEVYGLGYLRAI